MRIIFGASGGLGGFLYNEFSKNSDCLGTYYKKKASQDLVYCNVLDLESCDKVFSLISHEKKITVINATGHSYNSIFHKSDPTKWYDSIDVNIKGTHNVMRSAIEHMLKTDGGKIINLSSIVGQIAVPGTSSYSASKAALSGITRTLARE